MPIIGHRSEKHVDYIDRYIIALFLKNGYTLIHSILSEDII